MQGAAIGVKTVEEGYDEARRIWNGAIDRRPALITRCAGADDVIEAVRFTRERDLLVSVHGCAYLCIPSCLTTFTTQRG